MNRILALLLAAAILLSACTPSQTTADPQTIYLSDLTLSRVEVGFGQLGIGVNPWSEAPLTEGEPIVSGGVAYPHGLFAHAPARIDYAIEGRYDWISGKLLVHEAAACGNGVVFRILVDGREAYASPALTYANAPLPFQADVSGGRVLSLRVDPLGDSTCDWSVWGDPMLTLAGVSGGPPATNTAVPPTFTPAPTRVLPPTATPTPTPVPYSALSTEEKLARSQALVDAADNYAGEVFFVLDRRNTLEKDYPFYWHPELLQWKTLDTFSRGGHPAAKLDLTGSTLPPVVIPGYENDDGSLVMIDPQTGREVVFPGTVYIPTLGEVSVRSLFEMGQERLGRAVIDTALSALDARNVNHDEAAYQRAAAQYNLAVFQPGFVISSTAKGLWAVPAAVNGADIPETGYLTIVEEKTDNFVIPIYSPETGDFMFFLNVHRGHLASVLEFTWKGSGTPAYDWVQWGRTNFGKPGYQFGILIEHPDPSVSTWEGGGDSDLLRNNTGIGTATDVRQILIATSEAEILAVINQHRVFVAIPFRVAYPTR